VRCPHVRKSDPKDASCENDQCQWVGRYCDLAEHKAHRYSKKRPLPASSDNCSNRSLRNKFK